MKAKDFVTHSTVIPQTEQADPAQKLNNQGGYSFTIDKWKRLERFLILGTDGGTFYVNERKLTLENANVVVECAKENGLRTVADIVRVSVNGLAQKNDAAIFALAVCAASTNEHARRCAMTSLQAVCRTATHLFQFVEVVDKLRGWGPALRKAVAGWYLSKKPDQLAYQMLKYQHRGGWSHKDVIRLAHVKGDADHEACIRYAIGAEVGVTRQVKRKKKGGLEKIESYGAIPYRLPSIIEAVERLKSTDINNAGDVANAIISHNLTHEMIPNEFKNSIVVWEALSLKMPITALIRNLGKMTAVGALQPLGSYTKLVCDTLHNREVLKLGRVHPITILSALRVYAQGHGEKGSLAWAPVQQIIDALDDAFYLSFELIEPTGKPTLVGLDVSSSMVRNPVAGIPGLDARTVSAAMAMATMRTESQCLVMGFCDKFVQLKISANQRLDDVLKAIEHLPFGGTDCSLPMQFAKHNRISAESFIIYTDSETAHGPTHPHKAMQEFRKASGINAKLAVCGVCATDFTIADPNDAGMMDVVGFSSDCPAVLATFFKS